MNERQIGMAWAMVNNWLRRVQCDADGRDQINESSAVIVQAINDGLKAAQDLKAAREEIATLRAALPAETVQGH